MADGPIHVAAKKLQEELRASIQAAAEAVRSGRDLDEISLLHGKLTGALYVERLLADEGTLDTTDLATLRTILRDLRLAAQTASVAGNNGMADGIRELQGAVAREIERHG